jgi:hypothetical protein
VLAKCIGIPRAKAWVPVGQALKRNVRELEQSVSKEEKQARGAAVVRRGLKEQLWTMMRYAQGVHPSRHRPGPARPGPAKPAHTCLLSR